MWSSDSKTSSNVVWVTSSSQVSPPGGEMSEHAYTAGAGAGTATVTAGAGLTVATGLAVAAGLAVATGDAV